MTKEFFCDKKKFLIIKVATPLFYKEGFFPIPRSLSTNTWTFIAFLRMSGNNAVSFVTADNKERLRECLPLGHGPINYAKFSRNNNLRMIRRKNNFIF